MSFFVHEKGICESEAVGEGTSIWAFAHVLPGARIGKDCNICDGVFIENDVVIGDRVTIKCGVQVWDGIRIEDDVFIGPNATFTNDPFPRSKVIPDLRPTTIVRKGASIGANSTILPGITIGANAMIGAGAVVTRSVPPFAIVVGNPARIINYVGNDREEEQRPFLREAPAVEGGVIESKVGGVTLHYLPKVIDLRGNLTVGEFDRSIPFTPKRYFMVFDVPNERVRGQHAHIRCKQFLVCVKGSCAVLVDDGKARQEYSLDRPNLGLYLPPLVWGVQYKYSPGAILLVFASEYYDAADYIRDYDSFLEYIR